MGPGQLPFRGKPATGRWRCGAPGRGRIVVGHGARIGPATRIEAARYVEVGDRARIGAGCLVSDLDGAEGAPAEIRIGDQVTLGDGRAAERIADALLDPPPGLVA